MKISNWRKKVAASLAACGMISPAVYAANLNENLVANSGFESINFDVTGDYGVPRITGWLGGPAFAYSHNGTDGIPNYSDGTPPVGSGNWFFTSNNAPGTPTGDNRTPSTVYQDIDVSTGASALAIAAGKGRVDMQAAMSSYFNDFDYGVVRVDFRDAGGVSRGFAEIFDTDFGPDNVWTTQTGSAPIHFGTTTLRVSLFGQPNTFGADGYMDNIDVRVNQTANSQLLILEVNTGNGQMTIKNESGQPVSLDYYEITSAGNRLLPANWNSLQEQNLAGFPAGNGSGNGWEQTGGVSASVLAESNLVGTSSAANGPIANLGPAFLTGGAQDLVFRYGTPKPPRVLEADFNSDDEVDGGDILILQRNLGTDQREEDVPVPIANGNADYNRLVNAADLHIIDGEFGTGAGVSSLIRGVVRYVPPAGNAIPEPGSVLLAGIGIAAIAALRRR